MNHHRLRLALLTGGVTFILLVLFRTARFSYDAVGYAFFITATLTGPIPTGFWHPYHLLYMPLAALYIKGLSFLIPISDPLALMQILNALATAVLAGVLALLIHARTGKFVAAFFGPLALIACYGFRYYGSDPEVYPFALLFLTILFYDVLQYARNPQPWTAFRCGLWILIATGFHVASILSTLPALSVIGRVRPGTDSNPRWRHTILFLGTALLPALTLYALFFSLARHQSLFHGLEREIKYVMDLGYFPHHETTLFTAPVTFLFNLIHSILPLDFPFHRFMSFAFFFLLIVMSLRLSLDRSTRTRFELYVLLHLITFFLFFAYFSPSSLKFTGFVYLPLVTLAAIGLGETPIQNFVRTAIIALTITVLFLGVITIDRPQTHPETNPSWRIARWIHRTTPPHTLVIINGVGIDRPLKVYIPYFTGRPTLSLDLYLRRFPSKSPIVPLFIRFIQSHQQVVVLSTVFEDATARQWLLRRYPGLAPALFQWLEQFHKNPLSTYTSLKIFAVRPRPAPFEFARPPSPLPLKSFAKTP